MSPSLFIFVVSSQENILPQNQSKLQLVLGGLKTTQIDLVKFLSSCTKESFTVMSWLHDTGVVFNHYEFIPISSFGLAYSRFSALLGAWSRLGLVFFYLTPLQNLIFAQVMSVRVVTDSCTEPGEMANPLQRLALITCNVVWLFVDIFSAFCISCLNKAHTAT